MNVDQIVISSIKSTAKDSDRAESLAFQGRTFHGSGAPWSGQASKMAKAIKDPIKLVQRAKAVIRRWGVDGQMAYWDQGTKSKVENAWKPFEARMQQMGFSQQQINDLIEENYR